MTDATTQAVWAQLTGGAVLPPKPTELEESIARHPAGKGRPTAGQRIEAAIEKLEAIKARGSDGPWRVGRHTRQVGGKVVIGNDAGRFVAHYLDEYDAERIVTLHRTIDAQIAILREELDFANVNPKISADSHQLALADAILGSET